jgi:hypothetical protein
MAFRRLSGASIHGKGLRVGALFQDPQCLIDIIVTNENFQSGFLSRLNKQVGYKTAAPDSNLEAGIAAFRSGGHDGVVAFAPLEQVTPTNEGGLALQDTPL